MHKPTHFLVDIIELIGLCLIVAGAALIYTPAGLIVAGLFFVVGANLVSNRKHKRD